MMSGQSKSAWRRSGEFDSRQDYWNLQMAEAEREMSAFAMAIGSLYGAGTIPGAIDCWLELAERIDVPSVDGCPMWRRITIAAASHFAQRPARLCAAVNDAV